MSILCRATAGGTEWHERNTEWLAESRGVFLSSDEQQHTLLDLAQYTAAWIHPSIHLASWLSANVLTSFDHFQSLLRVALELLELFRSFLYSESV